LPISQRTQTVITRNNVIEEQICDFAFDPGATPIGRLDGVAKTSDDMERIAKWKHGDKIYGTHAKADLAMGRYRSDLNRAWGREKDYESNMIFINTQSEKKLVSEQLDELKK